MENISRSSGIQLSLTKEVTVKIVSLLCIGDPNNPRCEALLNTGIRLSLSFVEYLILSMLWELLKNKEEEDKKTALEFLKIQMEDCANVLRYCDFIKDEEFFKIRSILLDDMEKRVSVGGFIRNSNG